MFSFSIVAKSPWNRASMLFKTSKGKRDSVNAMKVIPLTLGAKFSFIYGFFKKEKGEKENA